MILERQPGLTVVVEADNGSPEELIAAVHTVARGDAVIVPSLPRRLLDTFATACKVPARTRTTTTAAAPPPHRTRA